MPTINSICHNIKNKFCKSSYEENIYTDEQPNPIYKVKDGLNSRLIIRLRRKDGDYDIITPFIAEKDRDIYLDCSKNKLFAKHLLFIVYTPLHGLAKLLSIPVDIYLDTKESKNFTDFLPRFLYRLSDIIHIPVFTLAMVAVHIFAVTAFLFGHSDSVYPARKIVADLELKMYRVNKKNEIKDCVPSWIPCFRPYIQVDDLKEYGSFKDEQSAITEYVKIKFSNHLSYIRTHCLPINLGKVSKGRYISPAYYHINKLKPEVWKPPSLS